MLKIRLQKVGRKHDPSYRVVLTDSRKATQSGSVIENLGFYNPRSKKGDTKLDGDRIKEWILKGAKTSDTVNNLLVEKDIIKGAKINVLPKRKPVEAEAAKEGSSAPVAESGQPIQQPAVPAAEEDKQEQVAAPVETPDAPASEPVKEPATEAEPAQAA